MSKRTQTLGVIQKGAGLFDIIKSIAKSPIVKGLAVTGLDVLKGALAGSGKGRQCKIQEGKGIFDSIKKLAKSKAVKDLAAMGAEALGKAATKKIASKIRGNGIRLAGQGVSLAGGRKKPKRKKAKRQAGGQYKRAGVGQGTSNIKRKGAQKKIIA